MKLNRYLSEIGIKYEDLPGNYTAWFENPNAKISALYDPRNQEDEEGFCEYEFFNLDHTFDLIIYSKMSYFREHIAKYATPGCFLYDKDGNELDSNVGHKKWLSTLDKIIEGFRISLKIDFPSKKQRKKIERARKLFIKYYDCLWY